MKTWINGKIVDLSAEEIAVIEAERKEWNDAKPKRQLAEIKKIRLQKLSETDYMALNDYTMPDHIKTWRQSLRDIPANNDSSKYDDLLKRDDKGNLTHAIWTQPTE